MFMRETPEFRIRIYKSTYFDKIRGIESIGMILSDFPQGPSQGAVSQHIKNNHMMMNEKLQKQRAEAVLAQKKEPEVEAIVKQALTGEVISTDPFYIRSLDTYISQGEELVKKNQLKINANSFLAAVKLRADYDKGKKDRSADLIKTLAGLASPNKKQD